MKLLVFSTSPSLQWLKHQHLVFDHVREVEAATRALQTYPYDLLFLDLTAPHDVHALRALLERAERRHPDLPVALYALGGVASPELLGTRLRVTPVDATRAGQLRAELREVLAYRREVDASSLAWGDMQLRPHERSVTLAGARVDFTAKEYLLVELLALNAGRLFSRTEILERVWTADFDGDDRIVDVYVRRIRQKLARPVVETVRGLGYRFRLPDRPNPSPRNRLSDSPLPLEARLMTLLAARSARAATLSGIVETAFSLLREAFDVTCLCVHELGASRAVHGPIHAVTAARQLLNVHLERALRAGQAVYETARVSGGVSFAFLPLVNPAGETWAVVLAQSGELNDWDEGTRRALEACAAILSPLMLTRLEMLRREEVEQQLRDLNGTLEARVRARTRDLERATERAVQARVALERLHEHIMALARQDSPADVLRSGLRSLLALTGAVAGVVWKMDEHGRSATACEEQRTAAGVSAEDALSDIRAPELTRGGLECAHLVLHQQGTVQHEVHLRFASVEDAQRIDPPTVGTFMQAYQRAFERALDLTRLAQVALTDDATGLPNLRSLLIDLATEMASAARHGTRLHLLLLEVTNIRELNDLAGYGRGNEVIEQLTRSLRAHLRQEDRVYRTNGATFVVLFRDRQGQGGSPPQRPLGELLSSLHARYDLAPMIRSAIVSYPEDGQSLSDVLQAGIARLSATIPHRDGHVNFTSLNVSPSS